MRLLINKSELLKGINAVSRVNTSSTNIDILKGILMTVKGDKVELFSTNSEMSIRITVEADVYEEGTVVLSEGKLFADMVRKLPQEEISLVVEEKETVLILESGKSRSELLIKSAEDYPQAPDVDELKSIEIGGEELKSLINKTAFAVAQNEIRPILQGIFFEVNDGQLNLVSLDGFKLAHAYKELKGVSKFSATIPGKSCLEIAKAVDSDEAVKLIFGNNHVKLATENLELTARLLEGEFIKYTALLSSEFKMEVVVERKELIESVERASLLAREGDSSLIKLEIDKETIKITSNSTLGKSIEEVEVKEFTGNENLEIAFNSKLLVEGIKAIQSEKVVIQLNGSTSPVLIVPKEETESYEYLAVPVRLLTK